MLYLSIGMTKSLSSLLASLPLFKNLQGMNLDVFTRDCQFITARAGDVIFEDGAPADFAYIIFYGSAKMIAMQNDRDTIMNFFGRNRILGAPLMKSETSVYPLTAIALEESGLVKIARKTFCEAWLKNDVLALELDRQIIETLQAFQKSKAMNRSSVENRVADLLLRLHSSQPKELGDRIMIRLTRQDIADAVGSTVESVIRVLSKWTKENVIVTVDHRVELKNISRLNEFLGG